MVCNRIGIWGNVYHLTEVWEDSIEGVSIIEHIKRGNGGVPRYYRILMKYITECGKYNEVVDTYKK